MADAKVLPPFKTLDEYAEVMGDELGEAYEALLLLQRRAMYLSDDIAEAVNVEVQLQLEDCQRRAQVIEYTGKRTVEQKWIEVDWD